MLLPELVDTITDGLDLDPFLLCSCGKAAETGVTTTCLRAGLVRGIGVEGFCGSKDVMISARSRSITKDLTTGTRRTALSAVASRAGSVCGG